MTEGRLRASMAPKAVNTSANGFPVSEAAAITLLIFSLSPNTYMRTSGSRLVFTDICFDETRSLSTYRSAGRQGAGKAQDIGDVRV